MLWDVGFGFDREFTARRVMSFTSATDTYRSFKVTLLPKARRMDDAIPALSECPEIECIFFGKII